MRKNELWAALAAFAFPALMSAQSGYTIYPIPQQQTAGTDEVSFSKSVTLVAESGIDTYTLDRVKQILTEHGLTVTAAAAPSATESNIYLGINGSNGTADALLGTKGLSRDVFSKTGKYDRHVLSLFKENGMASVLVVGENTDATFIGLASLEQILDNGTSSLRATTLYDYADQQSRGLVEGYYGYPYSAAVKEDLMRFMMRYKMNTYLYGAKSDPYHSQNWKDAYPTTLTDEQLKNGWLSQDMMRDVAKTSQETKVNFIWAIHPGTDFISSSSVVNDIMGKYTKMYELGVRQFAVFVDDVGVPSSDTDLASNANHLTQLQQAIEAKWNTDGAAPADTVRPLHFVPQVYCTSFAGNDVRKRFFAALSSCPDNITFYTTGYGVWSVPNNNDLNTLKNELGRIGAWWWNYPCNDNADGQIYTMDMYSNFYDLPNVTSSATLPSELQNGLGIVCNPMQEGEVAKTSLFSAADYAWNNKGFNNQTSWEASYAAVLPGNAEAQASYKFLALYLRYNDPDALNQMITQYKSDGKGEKISALMDEIMKHCDVLAKLKDSEVAGENLLYKDLSPWLLKLRMMASVTKRFIAVAAQTGDSEERWTSYMDALKDANSLSTAEEYKAYALEGMGNSISVSVRPSQPSERYLIKFVDYLKANALSDYFAGNAEKKANTFFSNNSDVAATVSGSTSVYMAMKAPVTLQPGEYVGLQLAAPTLVSKITLSDTLVANHYVAMSADGKNWTRITEKTVEPDGYVRYIGVVNNMTPPMSIRLTASSIKVSVPAQTTISEATLPSGNVWQSHGADYIKDGDLTTFATLNRNQQNGDAYTVKLSKAGVIKKVRVAVGTTNGDYMNAGKVQISKDNSTWTDLKVKGGTTTTFTLSLPQVVTYSDAVKYCDFDGEGQTAQYVRLYLTQANTSKWLRLYDIIVNGDGAFTQLACEDAGGNSLSGAVDGDASTSTASAMGSIVYNFQQLHLLKEAVLFCDPSTTTNATIEATEDGSTWKKMGDITSAVQHVDFTSMPSATAMRVNWTGDTTPAIYEITEVADADKTPVITGISSATNGFSAISALGAELAGGKLRLTAPQGIKSFSLYTADGKQVGGTLRVGGAQTAEYNAASLSAPQAVLVRVTLADGTTCTLKIMGK